MVAAALFIRCIIISHLGAAKEEGERGDSRVSDSEEDPNDTAQAP